MRHDDEDTAPSKEDKINPNDPDECCLIETLLEHRFVHSYFTDEERLKMIRDGRPMPNLENMGVNAKEYSTYLWLTGCPRLEKLFCWPCVLFSLGNGWTRGCAKTSIPNGNAKKHEVNDFHKNCQHLLNRWVERAKSKTIVPRKRPDITTEKDNSQSADSSIKASVKSGPSTVQIAAETKEGSVKTRRRKVAKTKAPHSDTSIQDVSTQLAPTETNQLSAASMVAMHDAVNELTISTVETAAEPKQRNIKTPRSRKISKSKAPPTDPSVQYVSPSTSQQTPTEQDPLPAASAVALPDALISAVDKLLTRKTCMENDTVLLALVNNSFTFGSWSVEDRRRIIQKGRPRVDLSKFVGENYELPWLTGSYEMDALVCWPCLLFGDENTAVIDQKKYGDNIIPTLEAHETSLPHLYASLKLKTKELDEKISSDKQNGRQKKRSNIADENLDLLAYLTDIVCFIHNKCTNNVNIPNDTDYIVKLMQHISAHDNRLKILLLQRKMRVSDEQDLSAFVSSFTMDIIVVMKNLIKEQIKTEVNDAPFVSLILGEVPNTPLLSVVARYIAQDGHPVERFITFIERRPDISAGYLLDVVREVIRFLDCQKRFVGYTYDGVALNPKDVYAFRMKMLVSFPQAKFFHYRLADLRQTVMRSLSQLECCRRFFHYIQELTSFVVDTKEAKMNLLVIVMKMGNKTPDQLDLSSGMIKTFADNYVAFMVLFQMMVSRADHWKSETAFQASKFFFYFNLMESRFLLALISHTYANLENLSTVFDGKFDPTIWEDDKQIASTLLLRKDRDADFEKIFVVARYNLTFGNSKEQESTDSLKHCIQVYKKVVTSVATILVCRITSLGEWAYLDFLINTEIRPSTSDINLECDNLFAAFPHFDIEKLKTQLNYTHSKLFFKQPSALDLMNYMHEVGLTEALDEMTTFLKFVLTVMPMESKSANSFVPASDRIASYVKGRKHITPSCAILSVEKDLLVVIQKLPNFYQNVISRLIETRED